MKVRIKNFIKRPLHWNDAGKMDYLIGKVVNVIKIEGDVVYPYRTLDEANPYQWLLKESDIECFVPNFKGNM